MRDKPERERAHSVRAASMTLSMPAKLPPQSVLQGEMYKGMGFETPVTWLTDFPVKGVWEFT